MRRCSYDQAAGTRAFPGRVAIRPVRGARLVSMGAAAGRVLATLVLLLVSGAGAGPVHAAEQARPLTPVMLQLNWKHQFQFAGYYAAIEKGYYRAQGFDVRVAEVQEGSEPVDAVLQGRAQFGVGASELALRRARGDPIVVLAVVLQHSPLVLIAGGSGLQSLHELAGKRLMLMPHETELYAYLEREGVPRSRFVEVPHTYNVTDLLKGKVEALSGYSTDEPFLLRSAGYAYSVFSPRASGIDFYGDSLFTTERNVREDRRGVEAFRHASLLGWQYALKHPREIAELIHSKYSQRHSVEHLLFEAEEMRRLMQPQLIEVGHMNPGRWRHIAEVYAELGMLPASWSLEGFVYDPRPVVDLTWLYRSLAAAALAAFVIGLFAVRQVRFNRSLRSEIERRAAAEGDLRSANERLERRLAEIRLLQGRLEEQAVRDSLTGLYNRRYLDETLERELSRAARENYPVSLALFDIDHFKELNDTHGHQAGDAFLQALAGRLAASVRASDILCRWGGEEFALVVPGMPLAGARQRAQMWLEMLRGVRVEFRGVELAGTVSAGVASYPVDGLDPAELLRAADEALYRAKRDGRNCVR